MTVLQNVLGWDRILEKLRGSGAKLEVPKKFSDRVELVDSILDNDKTGLISTIYEFMVATANVNFNIVTDNKPVADVLKNWANFEVNKKINNSVPRGTRGISEEFLRERWRSSFEIAKINWTTIDGYILPSSVYFLDPTMATCDPDATSLNNRVYSVPMQDGEDEKLKDKGDISYILRKPFNMNRDKEATPYFVKKGVALNALLKNTLKEKQGDILEEIIPYLLVLKAGDKNLVERKLMGNLEAELTKLKDSLKKYKRDHDNRAGKGDSILKGRYDVDLQHFIPELDKIFNETVMRSIDLDILYGLGLVELQGFGTRQEAIMNPKILFEELVDAVGDLTEFYSEIMAQIIERNKSKIKPNDNVRVVPGVIKATLTDAMKKLIKDYSNTGQLAIEDSFEALPTGFDYQISKTRRENELKNGAEDLFFPRVILNQDSNDRLSVPTRPNVTPQELPQENPEKKEEKAEQELSDKPYGTIDDLPDNIKSSLPIPAQITWLKAYNTSLQQKYDKESAQVISWSAVEKNYQMKTGGVWIKKPNSEKLDAQFDELSKLTAMEIAEKKSKLLDTLLKDKS